MSRAGLLLLGFWAGVVAHAWLWRDVIDQLDSDPGPDHTIEADFLGRRVPCQ